LILWKSDASTNKFLSQCHTNIHGWGYKRSGLRAKFIGPYLSRQPVLLEDGFIRSVRLEELIASPIGTESKQRASSLIISWRDHRISKYNGSREFAGVLPAKYVLLIDQVRGDYSIKYGLANEQTFENPDKHVVVKVHPDTFSNPSKSHFDSAELNKMDRVHVVTDNCHPVRLIENSDAVYTVTSQVGFEALIWGKRVRTFGMPFYAGWGLTDDELPAPSRRETATLEKLVNAALVLYPKYIDLETDEPCEVERAIEYIAFQRRYKLETPLSVTALGFSRWKKTFVSDYLCGTDIEFLSNIPKESLQSEICYVVWGAKLYDSFGTQHKVLRIEDGFLRSSGLGADLIKPLSLVVDDIGIYFDATRPSRLEVILKQQHLSTSELCRARQLRSRIVDQKLTKYNVGYGDWIRPESTGKIILIIGQVESDASIEFGSPDIQSNYELLKRVRQSNPEAYLVYKPHPDVVSNLRRKGFREEESNLWCDELIGNVDTDSLLAQIDELHTMTSLMGFEALLRGVQVVCYGLPFYAGWGLTVDKITCSRRNRELSLDELVHGALIAYPRYMHYKKPIFIKPEVAIDQLAHIAAMGVESRSGYRKLVRFLATTWAKVRRHDRP